LSNVFRVYDDNCSRRGKSQGNYTVKMGNLTKPVFRVKEGSLQSEVCSGQFYCRLPTADYLSHLDPLAMSFPDSEGEWKRDALP